MDPQRRVVHDCRLASQAAVKLVRSLHHEASRRRRHGKC
jgi:hypothetical protein